MSDDIEDLELGAVQAVLSALKPLPDEGRSRVLAYVTSRFNIVGGTTGGMSAAEKPETAAVAEEPDTGGEKRFETFGEFYDAAAPDSNGEQALVAGYWLQQQQGAVSFDAAAANKLLRDLGHRIANITTAINTIKKQRPALIIQLMKSGSARQSRKTYKVTDAGGKRVKEMLNG